MTSPSAKSSPFPKLPENCDVCGDQSNSYTTSWDSTEGAETTSAFSASWVGGLATRVDYRAAHHGGLRPPDALAGG